MREKRTGQVVPRFIVYIYGLLVMAFGIVLLIKADLGAMPWDVLHVGLYYQLGLTIGSWSIIVGFFILTVSALITKEFPPFGTFLNMLLVGLFIDMYLMLPFLQTPHTLIGKMIMFLSGVIINGYGVGIYISAQFGAGPRDSLMIAITSKTGWKVRNVRAGIELIVLIIGWQLGGPVFWGTILFTVAIGPIVGFALPQCQQLTDLWLNYLRKREKMVDRKTGEETNRGAGA
ncbi:YczE/YyaS/YitT family protein [Bacillus methanolicus]|uniref:YitT family protein n=1 Tax=Bacillus methanolicus (strain MGA3 / ATCC 53907) TaxID=796606 RepID=I3EAU5_BACMM|nr:YitT family protein [Bacillus methanolicus]AIE60852.1 hypothetical protein BMMGA3_12295 [Bacillus methanolicus MGA3]EIJ83616.1 hypothetical protein MGA3_10370 [Bacillus methanolicus MGA3]UQD52856.1 YitT family protein [Bacillus methanolicus]